MARRGGESRAGGREHHTRTSRERGLAREEESLLEAEESDLLPGPPQLDHDDLLAESEYNVRMAGGERLHLADGNRWVGVHEEEELSIEPEEIGRRTLEEATQDFQARIEDEELPDAEWPRGRWAGRDLTESGPLEEPDSLVTSLPELGDEQDQISSRASRELARRRGPTRSRGSRHRRSPR